MRIWIKAMLIRAVLCALVLMSASAITSQRLHSDAHDVISDVRQDASNEVFQDKGADTNGAEENETNDYSVHFTASLSPSNAPPVTDVLTFNDVTINQGQGYDPQSGIFTASIAGVYVFQVVVEELRHQGNGAADDLHLIKSSGDGAERIVCLISGYKNQAEELDQSPRKASAEVWALGTEVSDGENGAQATTGVWDSPSVVGVMERPRVMDWEDPPISAWTKKDSCPNSSTGQCGAAVLVHVGEKVGVRTTKARSDHSSADLAAGAVSATFSGYLLSRELFGM